MRMLFCLVLALGCTESDDFDTGELPKEADTPDEDDTGSSPEDDEFDFLRATALSDLYASSAPAVSIAIYRDGATVYAEAFGSARPEEDLPATIDTLFHIGSTTKMLTAMAVLQDVEDGALGLDTTLAEAVPSSEFALNAGWNDQITMHHLLTHTATLHEHYDVTANPDDDHLRDWHEDVYFEYLWLTAWPGAFWNYSNSGYNLAGLVIEELSGEPYADVMRARIFEPLGMDRTHQRKVDAEADGDYALGYGYIPDGSGGYAWGALGLDDIEDGSSARPAGAGTWSTPSQMMAVADLLLNGSADVISDENLAALTRRQTTTHYRPDTVGYGYGLMVSDGYWTGEEWHETPVWSHNGLTAGYSSEFVVLPEHDFAISVLSSSYYTDFSRTIATAITGLLDLGEPEPTPGLTHSDARLDDHVGTYVDEYNVGTIHVTRTDAGLGIEMPDLEELGYTVEPDLLTYADTIFWLTIDGQAYDLTFIGMPGEPSGFVKNRAFAGTRAVDID